MTLNKRLLKAGLEAALPRRSRSHSGALFTNPELPRLGPIVRSCVTFEDPDEEEYAQDEFDEREVLGEAGIQVRDLWTCAADGLAGGCWSLEKFTFGGRGYLTFRLADDERYRNGALLMAWTPAREPAIYRRALVTAMRTWGDALQFPFSAGSEDVEVESITNVQVWREIAREARRTRRAGVNKGTKRVRGH
jgi:hypothetical protein